MKYLSDVVRTEMLALLAEIKCEVRELAFHGGPLDDRFTIPRELIWQPLPGRDGITFFNVPAELGGDDLYAGLFAVAAGASYTASILDCSRLIVVSRGKLHCNGALICPGGCIWLASGEVTTWQTNEGCQGVVFYNQPCPENAVLITA